MEEEVIQKYKKAGEIAKKAIEYSKEIIKENMTYLEFTEKVEKKIKELGGDFAFPVNISANSIAAHYTAKLNDDKIFKKGDLVKIDIGVHIDGYIADTAYTIEVGNNNWNDLIKASEEALKAAIDVIKPGIEISKVGAAIEDTIKAKGFVPIANLSGHELEEWELHAGMNIPNFDNKSSAKIEDGMAIAVEPFATNGIGHVIDAEKSEIYQLINARPVRLPVARKILEWAAEKRKALPFCKRWVVNEVKGFGVDMAIRQLVLNESFHNFPVLKEEKEGMVSQTEHTILLSGGEKIVTTG
ncbi:MAG: type II methionyl aminopeptidase [Candidatus Aenigmarchaeota archaeon]|nr:type II methionyl aminopeptidase [Candidatus Aenigmarchaeota archaeon]